MQIIIVVLVKLFYQFNWSCMMRLVWKRKRKRRKETMTPVWPDMSKEWITSETHCSGRQKQTSWMLKQDKNEIMTESMAKGRFVFGFKINY